MPDYAWLVQYNPLAYINYPLYVIERKSPFGIGLHFCDCCLVLSGSIDFLTGRRRVLLILYSEKWLVKNKEWEMKIKNKEWEVIGKKWKSI
jgi:hypothetical protein